MIDSGMYLGIGFLAAGLSLLMVVPFVHDRAVRLTTRRVEDAQPSRAEVLADKDLQRAAIADAAIIGWRADLVRAMPQTATFYARLGLPVNVRGLRFDRVAATAEWRDGKPVLIVKGEISNDTSMAEEVPRLRLVVRNSEHQEIRFWDA